jgi:hypothetical protein
MPLMSIRQQEIKKNLIIVNGYHSLFFYVGGMDNMADFQIVDNMLNKAHI